MNGDRRRVYIIHLVKIKRKIVDTSNVHLIEKTFLIDQMYILRQLNFTIIKIFLNKKRLNDCERIT